MIKKGFNSLLTGNLLVIQTPTNITSEFGVSNLIQGDTLELTGNIKSGHRPRTILVEGFIDSDSPKLYIPLRLNEYGVGPHHVITPQNEELGPAAFNILLKKPMKKKRKNSAVRIGQQNPLQLPKVKGIQFGEGPTMRANPRHSYFEYNGRNYVFETISNNDYFKVYYIGPLGDRYFVGEFNNTIKAHKAVKNYIRTHLSLENPEHFPRTGRGRPRGRGRPKLQKPAHLFPRGKGRKPTTGFFILDIYSTTGKLTKTLISSHGPKATAQFEAEKISHQRGVQKVELSGPYSRKPTRTTPRR